jgi:O-succinylbenzoic acid--CoA ligase
VTIVPEPGSDLLAVRLRREPDALALVDRSDGRRWTWRELAREASAWAWRLRTAGVRAADRVALVDHAGSGWAALLHGCLRLGAVLVPLDPRAPTTQLEAQLATARPRLLVRGGRVGWVDPDAPRREPGDACLLFTSGTTGEPKAVRLTLRNQLTSAVGCVESLGIRAGERWLLTLSPHHVGGAAIFFRSAFFGLPVVTLPRFSEAAVVDALRQERPEVVSLVPTMVTRLLAAGAAPELRRMRAILVGGASAPASTVGAWSDDGLPVCPSYGLTETCSQVATVPPGRAAEMAGSCGVVHSQARVEIFDGRVAVRGPVVSPGYLDAAIDQPFVTGDLGELTPEGRLIVTGRADDVIVTGGENVNPEEVEAVLREHPGIIDAAVVGRPDPVWGAVLEALVVGDVEPGSLVAWSRERLPRFKTPRAVRRVGSLPRTEGGKLVRSRLAEL